MPRFSVERWKKKPLQAAAMSCGKCQEVSGMVGVDMVAQDGRSFAHGHFDIETAREFHRQFGEAIDEAERASMI